MIPSKDDPKEPNVELDDTTMEDLLIQRALAGSARDEDWSALEALAARDAAVWERLARSIRDGAELTRELASATAGAAAVDIPVIPTIAGPRIPTKAGSPWALRGGWLAAAAVSLFAVVSHLSPPAPAERSAETLGELPKILLEARPRAGGSGAEIIYVRRILERVLVNGVFEFHRDDAGRSVAVPIDPASLAPETSL